MMKTMKTMILLTAFVGLFGNVVSAQKVNWTDDRIDCMYTGIANVLPLSFDGVDEADVKMEVSDGSVEKNDKGQYVWRITGAGQTGLLICKYQSKEIARFELPRKKIGDPSVQTIPTNAKASRLIGVKVAGENMPHYLQCSVYKYEIRIVTNGDVEVLENKGSMLTTSNRTRLKRVSDDAQVFIENLKARCPGDVASRPVRQVQIQ